MDSLDDPWRESTRGDEATQQLAWDRGIIAEGESIGTRDKRGGRVISMKVYNREVEELP